MTNDRLIKLAGFSAIGASIILIILKTYIWIVTQSLSVQASLFDSILDGITSTINVFALIHAARPADTCHRFGHGKIEALAGFAQSIFITASGVWLLWSLIQNFLHPTPLVDVGSGMFCMGVATLITLALVTFQRFVIRRTKSLIIKTDSLHYETDLLVNIGVLVSLFLSMYFQLVYLDLLIGFIIAIYILASTVKILKTSSDILLDHEISMDDQMRVMHIVHQYPLVKHMVNLRTRSCGRNQFVELTLEFELELSSSKVAKESQKIIDNIQKEIPNADVVIQLYHSEL